MQKAFNKRKPSKPSYLGSNTLRGGQKAYSNNCLIGDWVNERVELEATEASAQKEFTAPTTSPYYSPATHWDTIYALSYSHGAIHPTAFENMRGYKINRLGFKTTPPERWSTENRDTFINYDREKDFSVPCTTKKDTSGEESIE